MLKNNTNISNQYHTIKLRLHGVNSSCMIQNEIPNTAKLKLVTDVFYKPFIYFFYRMYFLQYKSIKVYKDKYAINTPIQDNNQSPSPLNNTYSNQHIPTAEKNKRK